MNTVIIYTTKYCPFCIRAKHLLKQKKADYQEIAVDQNIKLRQEMMQKCGRHTVPQIWINQQHIGGCDELHQLEREGKLDTLLAKK